MSRNEKSRRGFDPLVYRFQDEAPEPGKVTQVADGVFWARLPLWGRLNHINVWLLKDYDGWTVVDTGIHTDEVKAIWETLFVEVLGGQPITRVIATHLHTDHTGNAGWLAQKFDCPLWMSRSDFYMCKVMAFD
jgi:glyoxylase-like metal-dependent hydrolase (beta-lactamase superfamily II)